MVPPINSHACVFYFSNQKQHGTSSSSYNLYIQTLNDVFNFLSALNEALKQEVERLKVATGEISKPQQAYDMGLHNAPYNPSIMMPPQQQQIHHQAIQLQPPLFDQPQPGVATQQMLRHLKIHLDELQQEPLGRFQGLDINKGSQLTKSESSTVSASESSSTF